MTPTLQTKKHDQHPPPRPAETMVGSGHQQLLGSDLLEGLETRSCIAVTSLLPRGLFWMSNWTEVRTDLMVRTDQ